MLDVWASQHNSRYFGARTRRQRHSKSIRNPKQAPEDEDASSASGMLSLGPVGRDAILHEEASISQFLFLFRVCSGLLLVKSSLAGNPRGLDEVKQSPRREGLVAGQQGGGAQGSGKGLEEQGSPAWFYQDGY